MFRNPRENIGSNVREYVKPSIGRPPTPPNPSESSAIISQRAKIPSVTPRDRKTQSSGVKKLSLSNKNIPRKVSVKSNASILSFFKKINNQIEEDTIFINSGKLPIYEPRSPELLISEAQSNEEFDRLRFNEAGVPLKKRRTSSNCTAKYEVDKKTPELHSTSQQGCLSPQNTQEHRAHKLKARSSKIGPFIEDSDTDDEYNVSNLVSKSEILQACDKSGLVKTSNKFAPPNESNVALDHDKISKLMPSKIQNIALSGEPPITTLEYSPKINDKDKDDSDLISLNIKVKSTNSTVNQTTKLDDWENLEGEQFSDDDFIDGEEYINNRWIKEQIELDSEDKISGKIKFCDEDQKNFILDSDIVKCPVCNIEFHNVDTDLLSKHVNKCLDTSLASTSTLTQDEAVELETTELNLKRSNSRKASVQRLTQESLSGINVLPSKSPSAFSKLMLGNVEDTAWANAAASEISSRGKQAFQRTCPFYKIIPKFSICVDAFRYGPVQGCNAYFLSHFHSDHYVGLSSSWCYGPIYCSKVTANLVEQQLRVDRKYVIPLEFNCKFEIPNTPHVCVTMIPANHCPGSSLFLYEKFAGKGSADPSERVLHCGDFRACPAHISHPLLMPDVLDSVTKKYKHQKIDVCYLDTTYLNPRYAFPAQDQVIQACANLCLSLVKESVEETNTSKFTKEERTLSDAFKYFETPKSKIGDGHIPNSPSISKNRGRLLIVCGTYSIGKERICLGIARALDCKIYAPARKMRILTALEDDELISRMTRDPREAQIHLQMLMEIRAETLRDYLNSYKSHFSRIVGFRPSGWTYKPPTSRGTLSATVPQILTSPSWRSTFSLSDLVPQRGSTLEVSCFGVPYSEHSSFRELTMFICALRIEKIIPTVNVGSASSRAKMKFWIERWLVERRKNGPIKIGDKEGEIKWY